MRSNRFKKFVAVGTVLAMSLSMMACGNSGKKGSSGDTIKIGVIDDKTGNNASIGMAKLAGYELAVEEINAAGGINGKQIELIECDGQSDNTVYQQMANKLCQEDQVDVVMGGLSSASREAIRPIMDQNKMLYFYNEQYEGGVADHYTFCTGATPEQQIVPVFGDLMNEYGKKVYVVAADYNFGQISADWIGKLVDEAGGKVVGEEFIPLDVSSFSSTISNIEKAKPDIVVTFLVGSNHTSFYEQWNNVGLAGSIPIFSTVSICLQYEHKLFDAPALSNTYGMASYIEELDTDAAKKFTEGIRKKYSESDLEYVNMEAETTYSAVYLYKAAVEKAGTTDKEKVIEALESGEITFDGPGGTITMDPATHHCIKDLVYYKINDENKVEFIKTFEAIEPSYLKYDIGVDLTKEDPCTQYTPE